MPSQNLPNPLSEMEMDRLMAALGPFEHAPHVAVGVSGGADSMALVLLADAWARRQGGRVTAITVDHGLRTGSATEARQVGIWLKAHGIQHDVLTWQGKKPQSGIQAAARKARYALMGEWCKSHGVLHLLLAHHLEDQAETFLLRLGQGSGIDGLAGMAGVVEKSNMRLLRPLLSVPKDRLRATLEMASQSWIEDPSNENRAFERVRIRQSLPVWAEAGMSPQALADTASRMARARIALETGASDLLARCCSLDPAGYARLQPDILFDAPEELSLRALARVLISVGGREYSPRLRKLERFHEKMKMAHFDDLTSWKGATLAGCRAVSMKGKGDKQDLLISRENRFLPEPTPVKAVLTCHWDGRFDIRLNGSKNVKNQTVRLQSLGEAGWSDVVVQAPEIRSLRVPVVARPSLPALFDDKGVLAAPHLNFRRQGTESGFPGFERASFRPQQSLSGTGFLVAE